MKSSQEVFSADKLLSRHGDMHTSSLNLLAEKIKKNFESPLLWAEETELKLDRWFRNFSRAKDWLAKAVKEAAIIESSQYPGHDFGHTVDNLNSALRIIEELKEAGVPVKEREVFEIAVACLIHDAGRYSEQVLRKLDDRKAAIFLLPAFILREFEKKFGNLPEEFSSRILFDIFSGSQKTTGHLTADIVHQSDREQLIGTPTIGRGLAFDVYLCGRGLEIPQNEELSVKLPIPDSPEDKFWLVEYEFYMRNLYPPTSPKSEKVYAQIKKENAIILMLALEGMGKKTNKQVFGPELGLVKPEGEGIHWSKKPIPAEIFEKAKEGESFFYQSLDFSQCPKRISDLIQTAVNLMKADGVVVPCKFEEVMKVKLEESSDQMRKNFWAILKYSSERRHLARVQDLSRLTEQQKRKGVEGIMAELVAESIRERERIFSKQSL